MKKKKAFKKPLPIYIDPIVEYLRKTFGADCSTKAPPVGEMIRVTKPMQLFEGDTTEPGIYLVCAVMGTEDDRVSYTCLRLMIEPEIKRASEDAEYRQALMTEPLEKYQNDGTWPWIKNNGTLSEDEIEDLKIDPCLRGINVQIDWRAAKPYSG